MIRLSTVSKSFGFGAARHPVLVELDLTVEPGEIVAMAGPSGSGKTTVLALLAGWTTPDSGQVSVVDGTKHPARRSWSDVAIVPQSLGLLPELTLEENLTVAMAASRDAPRPVVDTLTDQLGITHLVHRFPDEVSLGEQQRAAIARAALGHPKVLLADEPIAHQNQRFAREAMTVIRDLAHEGTAVLIATHNELAFDYCDRTFHMVHGALVTDTQRGG